MTQHILRMIHRAWSFVVGIALIAAVVMVIVVIFSNSRCSCSFPTMYLQQQQLLLQQNCKSYCNNKYYYYRSLHDLTYKVAVVLNLSLHYMNDTTASQLETKNSTNDVVAHFCGTVNRQAGGNQVKFASEEVGVFVNTIDDDNASERDCTVLRTSRRNDSRAEDMLGLGFFVLDVTVEQTVVVTSSGSVSVPEVTSLVKNGFNRGQGGRVRFRSLLREHEAFSSLLNVEMFDASVDAKPLNLSLAPVISPSVGPVMNRTTAPSLETTTSGPNTTQYLPTAVPTPFLLATNPPTLQASPEPSESPSGAPSEKPLGSFSLPLFPTSLQPTQLALRQEETHFPTIQERLSSAPKLVVDDLVEEDIVDANNPGRTLFVAAAISGGIGMGLVSLCLICCLWNYLQKKRKKDDESISGASSCSSSPRGVRRRWRRKLRPKKTNAISSSMGRGEPVIPDIVQLDDDHRSLANTTLGDQTAGGGGSSATATAASGVADKRPQSMQNQQQKKKKRLVDMDAVRMLDSFDDNSLYTTPLSVVMPPDNAQLSDKTTAPTAAAKEDSYCSAGSSSATSLILPPSLDQTLDFEEDIVFPLSDTNTDSSTEEGIGTIVTSYIHNSQPVDVDAGPVDVDEVPVDVDTLQSVDENEDPFSAPLPLIATDSSSLGKFSVHDHEKAQQISKAMDEDTKGPFPEIDIATKAASPSPPIDNSLKEETREDSGRNTAEPTVIQNADSLTAMSYSSMSSLASKTTKPIENILLFNHLSPSDENTEEEKREVGMEEREGVDFLVATSDESFHRGDDEIEIHSSSSWSSQKKEQETEQEMEQTKLPVNVVDNEETAQTSSQIQIDEESTNIVNSDLSSKLNELPYPYRTRFLGGPYKREPQHFVPITLNENPNNKNFPIEKEGNSALESSTIVSDESTNNNNMIEDKSRGNNNILADQPRGNCIADDPSRSNSILEDQSRNNSILEDQSGSNSILESQSRGNSVLDSQSRGNSILDSQSRGNSFLDSQSRGNSILEDQSRGSSILEDESRDSRSSEQSTLEDQSGGNSILEDQSKGNSILEDRSRDLVLTVEDTASVSSDSTGISNPWLFETVEHTLGPRSVTADIESLSGRSTWSGKSEGTRQRNSENFGSINAGAARARSAPASVASYGSSEHKTADSDISLAPRTLEHDLKRLEMQLAVLQSETDHITASSITISSVGGMSKTSRSSIRPPGSAQPKVSRKKRVIVVVPPGKLGVILANRHDGRGTIVSEVKANSALRGMLLPGDKLVAIDGEDVTRMVVSQITSIMASKKDKERRLTVLTSANQESKSDSP